MASLAGLNIIDGYLAQVKLGVRPNCPVSAIRGPGRHLSWGSSLKVMRSVAASEKDYETCEKMVLTAPAFFKAPAIVGARSGSASASMLPPQPAPDILAPCAPAFLAA